MSETEQNTTDTVTPITNTITVDRHTGVVALRALSQLWSDHRGGLDDEVLLAIEELERVTGVRLNLASRPD